VASEREGSMISLLWAIPCALANRIRGGWLGDKIREVFPVWNTLGERLFFTLMISMPVLISLPFRQWIDFFILFFAGLLFGWSPYQYMLNPKDDILILALRGLVLTAPAGYFCGLYWFGFSGALMGLCYWLGSLVKFQYRENGYTWVGSDWGEVIFGGVISLFLGLNIYLCR